MTNPKPIRIRLSCTVSQPIGNAINLLLMQGLHGNNRSEVIQRLICDAILERIKTGVIPLDQMFPPKVAE